MHSIILIRRWWFKDGADFNKSVKTTLLFLLFDILRQNDCHWDSAWDWDTDGNSFFDIFFIIFIFDNALRFPQKCQTHQANFMKIRHFRHIFPSFCSTFLFLVYFLTFFFVFDLCSFDILHLTR